MHKISKFALEPDLKVQSQDTGELKDWRQMSMQEMIHTLKMVKWVQESQHINLCSYEAGSSKGVFGNTRDPFPETQSI